MDKLPQEVIDRVACHLFPFFFTAWDNAATLNAREQEAARRQRDSSSAATYATISLLWQRAIENKAFTFVKIRSPEDDLMLSEIMVRNPHRRECVRFIKYNIGLDRPERATHFPFARDRHLVSKVRNIIELVNLIRQPSFMGSSRPEAPMFLQINIVNMKEWGTNDQALTVAPSEIKDLPICPAVTQLQITYDEDINLRLTRPRRDFYAKPSDIPPVWIAGILPKFPRAENFVWELHEYLDEGEQRTQLRTGICEALRGPVFKNLAALSLWIGPFNYESWALKFLMQPLTQPEGVLEDPLNVALRTLSQQLVSLQIIGIFTVTPDLFISRKTQAGDKQPYWPRLENLYIESTNWTYNGRWYILANNLTMLYHINDFLRSSTPEFNSLMVAVSQGMLNMPKLQKLDISFRFPRFDTGGPIDKYLFEDAHGDYCNSLLFHVIRYRRASSEGLEVADCKAAGQTYCNLDLFN